MGIMDLNSCSLPPLRAVKKGGGGVQVGLDILETNMSPQRTRTSHLSIIRVLSNPQKAALLPLGSYSSYRLVGKMY